jgi:hypothetical protein
MENYSEANAFPDLNQNGNELPSGTDFYKFAFMSSRKKQIGYQSCSGFVISNDR